MTSYATSAADMPTGTVVRLPEQYQDVPAGTTGTVVGDTGGWAVFVVWTDTDRRDFVSCRYLEIVSKPEAVKAAPGPLSLTIDGDEVTVTGSIRGDETHRAVLPRPWVWSDRADGYVLPRSLTPMTRASRIDQLRAACVKHGVPLEVDDAGTVQTEAERREARAERLEARANRHEHAAERASAEAESRYSAFRQIADGIPMGQPILVGHHSERGHRKDLERMDGHMRASVEADREAARRAELAENIRRNLERGDSPVTIGNRIERNEAETRRIERRLSEDRIARKAIDAGQGERAERLGIRPMGDDQRERVSAERDRLTEAVELDRATLAQLEADGRLRVFGKHDVSKGDIVRSRFGWHRVVRVNAKSVSVATEYSWTETLPYHKVLDVRPATEAERN